MGDSIIDAGISYKKKKTENKQILEFDPNRIKQGEAVVIQVPKWGGLLNQCFVILNVDGKKMIIRQLKEYNKK